MSDGTTRHTCGEVVDAAESLRERKKARIREAIIDAALELFEQKGYDATTVEDIAMAAEVSPRHVLPLLRLEARPDHGPQRHQAP